MIAEKDIHIVSLSVYQFFNNMPNYCTGRQYLKDVFGSTVLAINRPNFQLLFTGLVSKGQVSVVARLDYCECYHTVDR